MEIATLKQSDLEVVQADAENGQPEARELVAVELAYVGGGMGIHCWG